MAYYGPDEPSSTIFLERTFLVGDFISGIGYGIQLVLYLSCALYLWSHRKSRRQSIYLLVYITILLFVETMFAAVQARTVQDIYIDNRNYPGGPWAYFLASQNLYINVMFYATLFVLTFLSDILVVWRCWVIWRSAGQVCATLVTLFPALMLLASFVMGTLWTIQSSKPGQTLYSSLALAYGTSYYAISLGVNILITLLITIRLVIYRRQILHALPEDHAKKYVTLTTIIVESAALYSLFAVLFLITYAINNPINQAFLAIAVPAQQVAGYLIIYRVADGRAYKSDTMTRQTLPTMNFNAQPEQKQASSLTQLDTFQITITDTPPQMV